MERNIMVKEFSLFFVSSLIVVALVYFKVPTSLLQQIIAMLLIILLLLSGRLFFTKPKPAESNLSHSILLFLGSLIIQLLVVSTGGFFSPFMILLHLFTLGTSFLLNLRTSISFLVLSILILIFSTLFNQQM